MSFSRDTEELQMDGHLPKIIMNFSFFLTSTRSKDSKCLDPFNIRDQFKVFKVQCSSLLYQINYKCVYPENCFNLLSLWEIAKQSAKRSYLDKEETLGCKVGHFLIHSLIHYLLNVN